MAAEPRTGLRSRKLSRHAFEARSVQSRLRQTRPGLESLEQRALMAYSADDFAGDVLGNLDGLGNGTSWKSAANWGSTAPAVTASVVDKVLAPVNFTVSNSPIVEFASTADAKTVGSSRALPAAITGQATVYIEAMLSIATTTALGSSASQAGISLIDSTDAKTSEHFFFGERAGQTNWGVAIGSGQTGAKTQDSTVAIVPGSSTLLVLKIDQLGKMVSLYVNPDLSTSEAENTPAVANFSYAATPALKDGFDTLKLTATANKAGNTFDFDNIIMSTDTLFSSIPTWLPQGPAPTNNGQVLLPPNNLIAGAIQAIAPSPYNSNQVYIGTVNGGVWRTNNLGAVDGASLPSPTWTALTDQGPSNSISSIAFDASPPILDGRLDSQYGQPIALQRVNTQAGKNILGKADQADGSELDGLYAVIRNGVLYVMLTGDLQSNTGATGKQNNLNLVISTGASGQNKLAGLTSSAGSLDKLNGLAFDSGFQANYLINANVVGGLENVRYVSLATAGTTVSLGTVAASTIGGSLSVVDTKTGLPGPIRATFNDSNAAGVDGGNTNVADPAKALGARTGFEFSISLANLGNPTVPIRLQAFISSPDNATLTNQVLGGLPTATDTLGASSAVDFSKIAGDQFATVFGTGDPTVYAGIGVTGSSYQGGRSVGVLKSTDGGLSWFTVPDSTGALSGLTIRKVIAQTFPQTDPTQPLRDIVLAGSTLVNGNGGLFRSTDGGTTWSPISGQTGTGLPQGSVYDMLMLDDAKSTTGGKVFVAAVSGDGQGAGFDARTVKVGAFDATNQPYMQISARSQSIPDWKALGTTKAFRITVDNVTKTIRPNFSAVTSMDDVAAAINTALSTAGYTGLGAFWYGDGSAFIIHNSALDTTRDGFRKIERLSDPETGAADSLLSPLTGGLYLSRDLGATWTVIGDQSTPLAKDYGAGQTPVVQLPNLNDTRSWFRLSDRILLTSSQGAIGADPTAPPIIYAGVISNDKFAGLVRIDNFGVKSATVVKPFRFVEVSPWSSELSSNVAFGLKITSSDATNWKALGNDKTFNLNIDATKDDEGKQLSPGKTFLITPDFSAVTDMPSVASAIQAAIDKAAGAGFAKVQYRNTGGDQFIFRSNTAEALLITDPGGAKSLFTTPVAHLNLAGTAADTVVTADLFAAATWSDTQKVPDLSLIPGLALENTTDAMAWKRLGNTRGFSIIFRGKAKDVVPDFSTVSTVADVAKALQDAFNLALGASKGGDGSVPVTFATVVWSATTHRFLINNIADPGGFGDLGAPFNPSTPSLLDLGDVPAITAGFVTGGVSLSNSLPTAAKQGIARITVGNDEPKFWAALTNTRSFMMLISVTSNTTSSEPLTIKPDFTGVATMDDVAAKILAAINAAKAGLASSVIYDPLRHQLVITITGRTFKEIKAVPKFNTGPLVGKQNLSLFTTGYALLGGTGARGQEQKPLLDAQGSIHSSMVVDLRSPNIVYIGGVRQPDVDVPTQLTAGGGIDATNSRVFRVNTVKNGAPLNPNQLVGALVSNTAPHADSRTLVFLPGATAEADLLIQGDDGGIDRLVNPSLTNTGTTPAKWQALDGNLADVEFTGGSYDPVNDVIYGGTQDNASQVQSAPNSVVWTNVDSGDGNLSSGGTSTDGKGNTIDIRYGSSNNLTGLFYFEFDATGVKKNVPTYSNLTWTKMGLRSAPADAFDSGLTATEKEFTGFNTFPIAANSLDAKKVMFGGSALYESADEGNVITTQVMDDIDMTDGLNVSAIAYGGRINGADKPFAAYVARGSYIWYRENAGDFILGNNQNPFQDRTTTPPTPLPVTSVTMDSTNWKTAYAIAGSHVFVTIDNGVNWADMTGSFKRYGTLPKDGLNVVTLAKVAIGGMKSDVLLVGGQEGVWRAINPVGDPNAASGYPSTVTSATSIWTVFGKGLPTAQVVGLVYAPAGTTVGSPMKNYGDALVVTTRGRGAFKLVSVSQDLAAPAILRLNGTDAGNTFVLAQDSVNPDLVDVIIDNSIQLFQKSTISRIVVNGFGGDDILRIDNRLGFPGGISFDGGSGTNQLLIDGVNVANGDAVSGTLTATFETQNILLAGAPTGGAFKLNVTRPAVNGLTAATDKITIPYNATAAVVQGLMDTFFGAGNTAVTEGPLPSTPIKVTFKGVLTGIAVPVFTVDSNTLTNPANPAVPAPILGARPMTVTYTNVATANVKTNLTRLAQFQTALRGLNFARTGTISYAKPPLKLTVGGLFENLT